MPGKKGAKRHKKEGGDKAQENRERLIKEKLMREIKLGELTSERFSGVWREKLKNARMPEIKQTSEISWKVFERAMDVKDHRIGFLMDALEEAEDQYLRNVKSYTENTDRLLKRQETRLWKNKETFSRNLSDVLADRDQTFEELSHNQNESEMALRQIDFRCTQMREDLLTNARSSTISKVDDYVEDAKDERRIAASQLESRLENAWTDLLTVISEYRRDTEKRRKKYDTIERKDEIERRGIERQCIRSSNLYEEIRKLQERTASLRESAATELQTIRREAGFFIDKYRRAKTYFSSERKYIEDRMIIMSIEYNRSMAHSKSLIRKAERILMLLEISGKYETQDEKVVSHGLQQTISVDQPSLRNDPSFIGLLSDDFRKLNHFWRRLAAAQIIASELRNERDKLLSRASQLRESLKHRLSGRE